MSFLNLFKRRPKDEMPVATVSRIPAGERVYAIGDIHGRDDLFAALLEKIEADNATRQAAKTTLILLGDLIDRGPESAGVVERAARLGAPFDVVRQLIGNHEECFLAALTGDVRRLRYFLRIGGDATVKSYWRDDTAYTSVGFEELARRLPALVPQSHVDFLGRGEDLIQIGNYVFVHAGVRPGVPLDRQELSDLRWIRDEFLDAEPSHGVTIVYGHTISDEVDEAPGRIGIDTGAYVTGRLTALGLEGEERWILDTGDGQVAPAETPLRGAIS